MYRIVRLAVQDKHEIKGGEKAEKSGREATIKGGMGHPEAKSDLGGEDKGGS